jgi:cellulose biosynthesis protein BcsQ
MQQSYGVGIRKGGQGKSTTVSTLARLCAMYGARVLVVDLAQPGTTTASLRDIWPQEEHGDLSSALLSFRMLPAGVAPDPDEALSALAVASLPVELESLPSWSGGLVQVLPWDELLADAAAFLHSERVLAGILASLTDAVDLVLIDYPGDGGPLLTNAFFATRSVIVPLVPETPALEGLEGILRLLTRVREAGHEIRLGGILLTQCDPKNKRTLEIAQTILRSGEVEGESLGRKLFPFGIRQNEVYEQAFRYGKPIWERSFNPAHWAGYVLLAEWLLRDARLSHLANAPRRPDIITPDTPILDVTALVLDDPELRLHVFEKAHASPVP